MEEDKEFKLTESEILTLEREKLDSHLLKKYRRNVQFRKVYKKYILLLVFFILIVCSSSYLILWQIENSRNAEIIGMLEDYTSTEVSYDLGNPKEVFSVDFDGLKAINNSCFGWIKLNNTSISYPVVSYTNNDYYLNHSFDNSYNSAGWIFADYRNSCDGFDKNLIIYGHNRRDGTMFNPLNEICLNENWYTNKDNQIIKLYTETGIIDYQIFSIYQTKAETYYTTTSFLSDSVLESFLSNIESRSIFDFNVQLSSTDHIITLSTCSNNNAYRTIIHAKKIDATS